MRRRIYYEPKLTLLETNGDFVIMSAEGLDYDNDVSNSIDF